METTYQIDYSEPQLYLAIHSGHHLRHDICACISLSDAHRYREEDPFTDYFIADKKNHITQCTSRFEYDINRPRDRAVYQKPDDCWGLPIYSSKSMTPKQIHESLSKYDEFYLKLRNIIDSFLSCHDKLIVWDIHSYNHRRAGIDATFDADIENPEIIIGTNHYQFTPQSWKPLIDTIEQAFKAQPFVGNFPNRSHMIPHLDVRQNVKFPGGFLSQYINSTYGDRVCCIAIEFKKIWMCEWTQIIDHTCLIKLKQTFDQVTQSINFLL